MAQGPAIQASSSGGVSDGDKGDLTISVSGTVYTIDPGAVSLAKMANLAQDQFIGRVTASTGVPETATITAAARTVLDDTTVAAMVNTLGGATSTGTGGLARENSPTFTTPALGVASATSLALTTDLAVADGGTGASTLTAFGVLYGNGTGAIGATAVGTAGHVLTSNGAGVAPTYQAPVGGGVSDGDKGDVSISGSGTVYTVESFTVADAGGDTTTFPLLAGSATGSNLPALTDAGLSYNASTNALSTTTFIGALTGNATTATTLATARAINGVNFDGSAAISVSKHIATFTPTQAQPPSTNYATFDTRNSVAVLDFDDTTEESTCFVGVIPFGVSLASGIKVSIFVAATSATSGNVRFGVQFEKFGTDLDSDSFDSTTEAHIAVSGTSGIEVELQITATTIDSLAVGDRFRIKVYRDASDTTNDTVTGDAEVTCVKLEAVA